MGTTEDKVISIIKMKQIEHKTKRMLEVEIKQGAPIEEVLLALWVDENKNRDEVCRKLSITPDTLFSWLNAAHIYSRRLKFPNV